MSGIDDRFRLRFESERYRRWIAGKEVIIHCHHYNSRIQRTIEESAQIDGRRIIVSAAEAVFAEMCSAVILPSDGMPQKWEGVGALYAHLGFGKLDFSRVDEGVVLGLSSHFVEGWSAGLESRDTPVCTFTIGFLQGAIRAVTGKNVRVTERECLIQGALACLFEIDEKRDEAPSLNTKPHPTPQVAPDASYAFIVSPNVDSARIISALVETSLIGNEDGLIPAFGVYLASMPADYYNRIAIQFVGEMSRAGLGATARRLLVADAETCGLNTFRGIMSSAEWDGLIAPMIRTREDNLFGILAVSNGLGWGNWHVVHHEPAKKLSLLSLNGYEALGFREYRPPSGNPECLMLTGVAAGIMALIYGEGSLEERFGTFRSHEEHCICQGGGDCRFEVVSRSA